MLNQNTLSTFLVSAIFIGTILMTGCAGAKPKELSYDATPDSLDNIVFHLDDGGTVLEFFDHDTYEFRVESRVLLEGKYSYEKKTNSFAEVKIRHGAEELKFDFYFDDKLQGQYFLNANKMRFRIKGDFRLTNDDSPHKEISSKGKAPSYLANRTYQFVVQFQTDQLIEQLISFTVTFQNNGQYDLIPFETTAVQIHSGIFYYNKTSPDISTCILDGLTEDKIELNFKTGMFKFLSDEPMNKFSGFFQEVE